MSLPVLLAGPILRRVEPGLVSVWVATSEEADVKVDVFLGFVTDGSETGLFSGTAPVQHKAQVHTRRFGAHLHVAVVTVQIAPPQVLLPSQIYSYLVTMSGAFGTEDLKSLRLLEDVFAPLPPNKALGYGAGVLPNFALPPLDIADLRVLHGSCRKPHGGGDDALAYVDKLIDDNKGNPARRPHQLFLTGDQIYADDVAMALLPALIARGNELLAPGAAVIERLPAGGQDREATAANFPANRRMTLIQNEAGMSSDEAESHLLSFGEFCAMYLFAWSNSLWPDTLATADSILIPPTTAPPTNALLSTADNSEKTENQYEREVEDLKIYRETLPNVRRALANVPVYMIFDDHEITDDWYLTRGWRDSVLSKNLGKAILRNGLAAYAIFQAWGNDPVYFTTGAGAALLNKIEALFPAGAETGPQNTAALDADLGIGTAPPVVRWSYTVSGPAHRVIVLDTRTRRSYATPNSNPGLVDRPAIDAQLPSIAAPPSVSVTLLVSPAPVLGLSVVEELGQPVMIRLKGAKGQFKMDAEAWSFEPFAFEVLLQRLAASGAVVILSGDVHYGFSAAMDYWRAAGLPPRRIAQFTSSALKNQLPETLNVFLNGPTAQAIFGAPIVRAERLGWHNVPPPGPVTVPAGTPFPPFHLPRVHTAPVLLPTEGWPDGSTVFPARDWAWRLTLMRDERSDDPADPDPRPEAIRPERLEADIDPAAAKDGYRAVAAVHAAQVRKAAPRRVVWSSNVGVVRFSQSGTAVRVRHELFTRLGQSGTLDIPVHPDAYTVHEVTLDTVTATEPSIPSIP